MTDRNNDDLKEIAQRRKLLREHHMNNLKKQKKVSNEIPALPIDDKLGIPRLGRPKRRISSELESLLKTNIDNNSISEEIPNIESNLDSVKRLKNKKNIARSSMKTLYQKTLSKNIRPLNVHHQSNTFSEKNHQSTSSYINRIENPNSPIFSQLRITPTSELHRTKNLNLQVVEDGKILREIRMQPPIIWFTFEQLRNCRNKQLGDLMIEVLGLIYKNSRKYKNAVSAHKHAMELKDTQNTHTNEADQFSKSTLATPELSRFFSSSIGSPLISTTWSSMPKTLKNMESKSALQDQSAADVESQQFQYLLEQNFETPIKEKKKALLNSDANSVTKFYNQKATLKKAAGIIRAITPSKPPSKRKREKEETPQLTATVNVLQEIRVGEETVLTPVRRSKRFMTDEQLVSPDLMDCQLIPNPSVAFTKNMQKLKNSPTCKRLKKFK